MFFFFLEFQSVIDVYRYPKMHLEINVAGKKRTAGKNHRATLMPKMWAPTLD
jgi:hypothetical protein